MSVIGHLGYSSLLIAASSIVSNRIIEDSNLE